MATSEPTQSKHVEMRKWTASSDGTKRKHEKNENEKKWRHKMEEKKRKRVS